MYIEPRGLVNQPVRFILMWKRKTEEDLKKEGILSNFKIGNLMVAVWLAGLACIARNYGKAMVLLRVHLLLQTSCPVIMAPM